jgi:hypothetical protein
MPGLLRGVARTAVIAGTATAVSNNVSRRQSQRWSDQEQDNYAAQEPQVDDTTAQLQQLAQLKNQGILTEEEFSAKKKQLLGI